MESPATTRLATIRQAYPTSSLGDIEAAVRAAMDRVAGGLRPGARIALAVGSRGIANHARIVRAAADALRRRGASPFVVPAMGSHGGATAAGQEALLAGYGITAAAGAPVRSSMDVVRLPKGDGAADLFMDRHAWESDGVVLVNRIKPHTDYRAPYESGLMKMAVIGLGKHEQAREIHRHGVRGLVELLPAAAGRILATGKILGGLAIVENARDETLLVRGLRAEEIPAEEPGLLAIARSNMPRLPCDDIDVLVVDRIGKDISGVGMDPNVIGRMRIPGQPEPAAPRIRMIVACDLTDASHGNGLGLGLADVITRRLYRKVDFTAVYENVMTSLFLERAKVPVTLDTPREAFELALRCCGPMAEGGARVMRVRDTLHLDEVGVSPALFDELRGRDGIEPAGEPAPLFDSAGELTPF